MKKLKKLFITLIIACLVIIAFGEISNVKAESAGPMYLGIVSLRRSGYGYTQSGKKVWKIAQYNSTSDTVARSSRQKQNYILYKSRSRVWIY